MSFLKKVFGGKKEKAAPTTTASIQNIQETEDLLKKKQEVLEEKINHEHDTARQNASTNKRSKKFRMILIINLIELNHFSRNAGSQTKETS